MYEVGQTINVMTEAVVVDPTETRSGFIRVMLTGDGDWSYVSLEDTSDIVEKPTHIAFEDIQVGDVINAKSSENSHGSGVSWRFYENVTVYLTTQSYISVDGSLLYPNYSFELVSRVEPIKVGDMITIEQVKTLPLFSLVKYTLSGHTRAKNVSGLRSLGSGEVFGWRTYSTEDTFIVKYIAEESE